MTNPEIAIVMLCLFMCAGGCSDSRLAFTLVAIGVGLRVLCFYQGGIEQIADLFKQQHLLPAEPEHDSVMENDTLVAIPLFLFMGICG